MGKELDMAVRQCVRKSKRTHELTGFKGVGQFFDEQDLKEKYKNKPEQFDAILKNAKTMEHPTRNVTLYEDLDFESRHDKSVENTHEDDLTLTADHKR